MRTGRYRPAHRVGFQKMNRRYLSADTVRVRYGKGRWHNGTTLKRIDDFRLEYIYVGKPRRKPRHKGQAKIQLDGQHEHDLIGTLYFDHDDAWWEDEYYWFDLMELENEIEREHEAYLIDKYRYELCGSYVFDYPPSFNLRISHYEHEYTQWHERAKSMIGIVSLGDSFMNLDRAFYEAKNSVIHFGSVLQRYCLRDAEFSHKYLDDHYDPTDLPYDDWELDSPPLFDPYEPMLHPLSDYEDFVPCCAVCGLETYMPVSVVPDILCSKECKLVWDFEDYADGKEL